MVILLKRFLSNSNSLAEVLRPRANDSQLSKNIHNCSWIIAFMDGIEYARPLTLIEKNFIEIVKSHLAKLLEAKRIY
jgi:hypothetical protein